MKEIFKGESKMKIIVCVDDKNGVSFNNRRQSRDKVLNEKLTEMISDKELYLSPYSAKLFDGRINLVVSEDYLKLAPLGAYCFVEREELAISSSQVEEVILVKWNRVYPRDKVFKFDMSPFKQVKSYEFVGSSHEKIGVEVYEKIR